MISELKPYRFLGAPVIKGLTLELVFDLRDILEKFAYANPETGKMIYTIESFADGTISETPLVLSAKISRQTLRDKGFQVSRGNIVPEFKTVKTNQGLVLWDLRLSPEGVSKVIAKVDEDAKRAGLINFETGKREIGRMSYRHLLEARQPDYNFLLWGVIYSEIKHQNQQAFKNS